MCFRLNKNLNKVLELFKKQENFRILILLSLKPGILFDGRLHFFSSLATDLIKVATGVTERVKLTLRGANPEKLSAENLTRFRYSIKKYSGSESRGDY